MPFNRIDRVSWADLTPGQIAGYGIIGDPAHAHLVLGTDGHGSNGLRLYAADGVTVLIDINAGATPSIDGSLIAGSVAHADSATVAAAALAVAAAAIAGQITSTQITPGAITTPLLAANAVATGNLQAGAVTAAQIAADTITAAQIAADTITAAQIAVGAITATELAADSVTAAAIAAGSITTDEIAAGAVTADRLDAEAINGQTITGAVTVAGELDLTQGGSLTTAGLPHSGHGTEQITYLTGPNVGIGAASVRLRSGSPDGAFPAYTEIDGLPRIRMRDTSLDGRQQAGLASNVTTDGSGSVTITHGLGVTPVFAQAIRATAGTATYFTVSNPTTTQVTFTAFNAAGAIAGATMSLRWFVFG